VLEPASQGVLEATPYRSIQELGMIRCANDHYVAWEGVNLQ